MNKPDKPDFTRKANWPIFGDTLTFFKNNNNRKEQYIGIISEWNVGGSPVWTVDVEGRIFYVHSDEILSIERTGEIPEYIPNDDR